jgi:hypothetical protein
MANWSSTLVLALCLLSVLASRDDSYVAVYVEPNGNASCFGDPGSVDCPCVTLLEALNLAYEESSGLVHVLLNPGNYTGPENSQLFLNSSTVSLSFEYSLPIARFHL